MLLTHAVALFLDSRKRGTTGARRQCSPGTLSIYRANFRWFVDWMMDAEKGGVLAYEDITRLKVSAFLDWLDDRQKSGQWSRATALQMLRVLRTFFRWVDLDDDCQEEKLKGFQKYLPSIEKAARRTDIPDTKELKAFCGSWNVSHTFDFRDYVATMLMLDTGIRIGEVCNLKVNELRLDEHIVLVNGKQGPRHVAATAMTMRLLKLWLKRRIVCRQSENSPYVFVSKYRPQMNPHAWGSRCAKHCKKFGFPPISAHRLRHAFCTNYLRKGGDMERLRMMTGHTSYEMLKDYLHLAKLGGKSMQEELEKVSILKDL